jgi:hypothetical protein
MPSKFDFISPEILLREIDESQVPPNPVDDGILIIGQAKKGPAMKPIRISNIPDLEATFGETYDGVSTGDIWRNGNTANPTYGLFAAKAWLASNTSPVTYVRLAGEEVGAGFTDARGGWNLGGPSYSDSVAGSNTVAYGLWMVPSASASEEPEGTLAAVFYTKGATLTLSGTVAGTSDTADAAGTLIKSSGANGGFVLVVNDGSATEKLKFNMSSGDASFVSNVVNTDPHKLISGQKGTQKKYFLGESFETEINDTVLSTSSSAGKVNGILLLLAKEDDNTASWIEHNTAVTNAKTGWFIANDPTPTVDAASFDAANMKKLFRFHSLIEGADFQKQYSIRIAIDRVPTGSVNQFAGFTVEVFDMHAKVAVEQFVCDLNPNSDNYIAKKIGDQEVSYNATKKKFVTTGEFPNISSYIRVEMSSDEYPNSAIPFGFYGPLKPKAFKIAGHATPADVPAALDVGAGATFVLSATSSTVVGGHTGEGWADYRITQTSSFSWPSLNLTDNNSSATFKAKNYFGFRHQKKSDTNTLANIAYRPGSHDYIDILQALPNEVGTVDGAAGTYTEVSFIFTLNEIVQDGSDTTKFYYQSGAGAAAYTAINGTNALIETVGINKIIAPFMGGADGLDIQYVDPFSSYQVMNTGTKNTNYAIAAVDKAIDFISNSEYVKYDVVAMPGITKADLVEKLLDNTEERGDALAIIDFNSGFVSGLEKNTETAGSVSTVVANAQASDFDTSYGAAYYPEVKIRVDNGSLVTMPSSVAGLGAIAQSEAASGAPWFAPAGFNRGGISSLGGPLGPRVIGAAETLSKSERDSLYVQNINPIANFPGEGPVVFGQKTLQQTASALDRINVRRLMIYLKKNVGQVARNVLFDQNVQATWNRFKADANPILEDAKSRFGISDYRLILDETTTTPDYQDRNIMYAKVFIKPAKAIEFIAIDFTITRSGIEF